MSQLIPTPVNLQDLLTSGSDINTVNDGIKTQEVSPRVSHRYWQNVIVKVKDDPLAPATHSGTTTATAADKLTDSGADFSDVEVGDTAVNTTTNASAVITAIDSGTVLSVDADVFPTAETYKIIKPAYWNQEELLGEWKKADIKNGNNVRATYPLPTAGTASSVVVHQVVYPVAAPENTGNYPPAPNA